MTTHAQIADRWASRAATGKGRLLGTGRNSNLYPSSDGSTLYSWGPHFPLAVVMSGEDGPWFLVNGDTYSISTTRHQRITRDAITSTGLPSMIVPFSAIERAGIVRDSIVPVEILPDETRYTRVTVASLDDVPQYHRPLYVGADVTIQDRIPSANRGWYDAEELPDGRWTYESSRHWLGSAVFTARYEYSGYADPAVRESWQHFTGTATFLSAFDEQEPSPLYFLAQLPDGEDARTYDQAIDALKPAAVKLAETEGLTVLRQGDVFAIPVPATTREVHSFPSHMQRRGTYVLGVNHIATDITEIWTSGGEIEGPPDLTYARGILRHRPREWGRRPEHRSVKLGDRKTWHRLVRNTVPEGRSWSILGNVD